MIGGWRFAVIGSRKIKTESRHPVLLNVANWIALFCAVCVNGGPKN